MFVDPGSVLLGGLGCAEGTTQGLDLLRDGGDVCLHAVAHAQEVQLGRDQSRGADALHGTHVCRRQQEDDTYRRGVSCLLTLFNFTMP